MNSFVFSFVLLVVTLGMSASWAEVIDLGSGPDLPDKVASNPIYDPSSPFYCKKCDEARMCGATCDLATTQNSPATDIAKVQEALNTKKGGPSSTDSNAMIEEKSTNEAPDPTAMNN